MVVRRLGWPLWRYAQSEPSSLARAWTLRLSRTAPRDATSGTGVWRATRSEAAEEAGPFAHVRDNRQGVARPGVWSESEEEWEDSAALAAAAAATGLVCTLDLRSLDYTSRVQFSTSDQRCPKGTVGDPEWCLTKVQTLGVSQAACKACEASPILLAASDRSDRGDRE
jgi:hypothetical protein